eukprot:GCRY01002120.1.p1 GENE.GCRY01002120.1~~GCRY01002120.1.p1  ORF type:complete len:365 (-),score=30.90 GCRY01002120.1:922-2016(-)
MALLTPCENWTVETPGSTTATPENPVAVGLAHYQNNFKDKDHWEMFSDSEDEKNPTSISILYNKDLPMYEVIVRVGTGTEQFSIFPEKVKMSWWKRLFGISPSVGDVLKSIQADSIPKMHLYRDQEKGKGLREVEKALIDLDVKQLPTNFKFGVLLVKEGQTDENEFFSNVSGSFAYERFLECLGDRINLKDWKQFRGGLDIKHNMTGETSIFTTRLQYEIMYHISTLLPFNLKDVQQIERKRYIGNDICSIIFLDTPKTAEYIPASFTSHQHHVAVIIRPVSEEIDEESGDFIYSVAVVHKSTVPAFGPIPQATVKAADLRNVLADILISGELSSYNDPAFQNSLARTRRALISNVIAKFGEQ